MGRIYADLALLRSSNDNTCVYLLPICSQLFPGKGGNAVPPTCNASVFTVPPGRSIVQPWASSTNPGRHSMLGMHDGRFHGPCLIHQMAFRLHP